jgi:hypothetical protein
MKLIAIVLVLLLVLSAVLVAYASSEMQVYLPVIVRGRKYSRSTPPAPPFILPGN